MTSPESKTLISGPLAALGAFATLGVGVLIGLGVEMNTATPTPRQSELSTPAVALRSPTRAPHEPAPSGDKSAAPLAVEPPLDASAGAAEAEVVR